MTIAQPGLRDARRTTHQNDLRNVGLRKAAVRHALSNWLHGLNGACPIHDRSPKNISLLTIGINLLIHGIKLLLMAFINRINLLIHGNKLLLMAFINRL